MAKNYQQLWKDVASTSDEGKAVRTLAEIVLDKEGRTFILELERGGAELCIEILDRGLAEHNLKNMEKQAFFAVLGGLAAIHGRLPESMMITEEIDVSDEVLPSGGFADVRTGTYMGHLVAVKTMRIAIQDDFLKIRKQFCKEVILWNTLLHPNILKLAGVQGDMDQGQLITISEWMPHGNIMEYVQKNYVNRLELLHGAAQGLSYLHDCAGLTHGDLKGTNILMSNDSPPRACLADFGFMTMVLGPSQPMYCSTHLEVGTTMFMSPELLVPSKFGLTEAVPTPEADIYAFGLVIYQVLTGKFPFHCLRMTEIALNAVRGVRPTRPGNASALGFSDSLWGFVQHCWDGQTKTRPMAGEVVSRLEKAAANWDGVMSPYVQVECVVSASPDPVSDSMAHCGISVASSPDAVLETPTASETISTSFDPPSTVSTRCTKLPSVEAREVVIKPSSERDLAVKGDRNSQDDCRAEPGLFRALSLPAPQFQERPPHNTPPQPDLSFLHHPFSQASYPGIETQALSPPEHHHPQPELRASTPPPEEQSWDDISQHLERRYQASPSRLPKKERRIFKIFGRDWRRKILNIVGFGKESPQPKRRSVFYLSARRSLPEQRSTSYLPAARSLPDLPLDPGIQKADH